MAKKESAVQTEETTFAEGTEVPSEVQEVQAVVAEVKTKRIRRVTSEITLPKDGSTGLLTYNVVGLEQPIVKEVNIAELQEALRNEATLVGLNTRVSIAYSGMTDPAEIAAAIDKEFGNFAEGRYISRASMERKVNAPDIVIAWVTSVGADVNDGNLVAKYANAWQGYDEARKATISNNRKVIIALEELQAARRLEKKGKTAIDDDSILAL
jgi:hypothetical protein